MTYNRQVIRKLVNTLPLWEFEELVFDYFPDVERLFTEGQNQSQKSIILLKYVFKYNKVDILLNEIQNHNSNANSIENSNSTR